MDQQHNLSLIIKSNRIAKHHRAHQIYKCQCGKEYLAFSSLYLHANLKHNKRLTTQKNKSNCKIQKVNYRTIITYFLNPSQNITCNKYNNPKKQQKDIPNKTQLYKNITKTAIIRQYLVHLQQKIEFQGVTFNTIQHVMNNFIDYFNCVEALTADTQDRNGEERDLTEYFNDFAVYYLPVVEQKVSFHLPIVVTVLYRFYQWLKEKRYTSMYLVCDSFYGCNGLQ